VQNGVKGEMMDGTTTELIGIAATLREALSRLDGHHLLAACAFIDHAVNLLDEAIVEDLSVRRRIALPPDSAFVHLDAAVAMLFPDIGSPLASALP
jgi:hypothetical protein